LTACSDLHGNCLHGELVAIGVMAQLIMEKRMDEAEQAARFFKDVGLPLHLAQLGFDPLQRESELDTIVQHSLSVFFIGYEPFEITHGFLKAAMLEANEFGKTMERSLTRKL
jgi:glycerol dehydrogenase